MLVVQLMNKEIINDSKHLSKSVKFLKLLSAGVH